MELQTGSIVPPIPEHGTLFDDLFDRYCLENWQKEGASPCAASMSEVNLARQAMEKFSCTDCNSSSHVATAICRWQVTHLKNEHGTHTGTETTCNFQLCWPSARNAKAIDALLQPCTELQITCSSHHLLDGSGILAWMGCLQEKKEAARIIICFQLAFTPATTDRMLSN